MSFVLVLHLSFRVHALFLRITVLFLLQFLQHILGAVVKHTISTWLLVKLKSVPKIFAKFSSFYHDFSAKSRNLSLAKFASSIFAKTSNNKEDVFTRNGLWEYIRPSPQTVFSQSRQNGGLLFSLTVSGLSSIPSKLREYYI